MRFSHGQCCGSSALTTDWQWSRTGLPAIGADSTGAARYLPRYSWSYRGKCTLLPVILSILTLILTITLIATQRLGLAAKWKCPDSIINFASCDSCVRLYYIESKICIIDSVSWFRFSKKIHFAPVTFIESRRLCCQLIVSRFASDKCY